MSLSLFSIRSEKFGELSFTENIPDTLHGFLLPGAYPILAQAPSGYLLFQEIEGQDFSLYHHTILMEQEDRMLITSDQPILSLNFCLANSFSLCRSGCGSDSSEELIFHEGHYNMNYSSKINLEAEFLQGRAHQFLTLFYSPDWLARISVPYPSMRCFLDKASRSEDAYLFPANQVTSAELKKIINELLHISCREEETKICIKKGKAMEILIQVLEQTMIQEAPPIRIGLSKADAEKIYAARDHLDACYDKPVTLFELARKVAMNVHKLSSGFHQITGTTVFCYHRNVRMKKAVELLEDTDRNLFDIGTEVGYMDGKSFSKEFKKDKGVTPFEYRRKLRLMNK